MTAAKRDRSIVSQERTEVFGHRRGQEHVTDLLPRPRNAVTVVGNQEMVNQTLLFDIVGQVVDNLIPTRDDVN